MKTALRTGDEMRTSSGGEKPYNLRVYDGDDSSPYSVHNRDYYQWTKEGRKAQIVDYLMKKGAATAKDVYENLKLPSLNYAQKLLRELELEGRIHSYDKRPKKYFAKVPWEGIGLRNLKNIKVAWEECDGFQVHRIMFWIPRNVAEPLFELKEGLWLDNLILKYEANGKGNLWIKATRTSKLCDDEGRRIMIQISRRGCVQVIFKKGSKPFPRTSEGFERLMVALNRARDVIIDLIRAARAVSSPQRADQIIPLPRRWILNGYDLFRDGKLLQRLEFPLVFEEFQEIFGGKIKIVHRIYRRSGTNVIRREISYRGINLQIEAFKSMIEVPNQLMEIMKLWRQSLSVIQKYIEDTAQLIRRQIYWG